jgi:hypothetical protein
MARYNRSKKLVSSVKSVEASETAQVGLESLYESPGYALGYLSGSYVGSPGEISCYQYKLARYARKRWLKSEFISSVIDPEEIINIVLYGYDLSMYRMVDCGDGTYEMYHLVSVRVQDWFLRNLLECGSCHAIMVEVRRKYFNYKSCGGVN